MDYRDEVTHIIDSPESKRYKIEQLEQLAYDCQQQMEAQDQNMNPTVRHKLSEGLRMAKDALRQLQQ
jgi:hypothetical protein